MWSYLQLWLGYFVKFFFTHSKSNYVGDNPQLEANANDEKGDSDSCDVDKAPSKEEEQSFYSSSVQSSQSSHLRRVTTYASPGLMTLIDTALHRAHEGQLTATISSANATLIAFLHLKSHAKRLLYTCLTLPPPPSLQQYQNGISTTAGTASTAAGNAKSSKNQNVNNPSLQYYHLKRLHLEHINALTSFAKFCIESSNEAITSITTDNLSKSANLDPIISSSDNDYYSEYDDDHNRRHFDYDDHDDDDDNDDDHDDDLQDNNIHYHRPVIVGTSTATTPTKGVGTDFCFASPSSHASTPTSSVYSYGGTTTLSPLMSSKQISPIIKDNTPHEAATKYYVKRGVSLSKFNYWNEVGLRSSSSSSSQYSNKKNWESDKLFCVDYVWADHSMNHCQRMVRSITKHENMEFIIECLNYCQEQQQQQQVNQNQLSILPFLQEKKIRHGIIDLLSNMVTLLNHDLPLRLQQFRCGIERNTSVSKRLYLIKNECRAPFRAFLEGHDHVQRAPDLSLVKDYIKLHDDNNSNNNSNSSDSNNNKKQSHNNTSANNTKLKEKKKLAERKIQDYINDARLKEALMIEYKCEALEIEMGMILYPFCNLARVLLDGKGLFHLVEVPGILPTQDIVNLQELLRRLKSILCKKAGVDTSTGIRPLLQDLQGIPRDPSPSSLEIHVFGQYNSKRVSVEEAIDKRLDRLCSQLQCLHEISKLKGGFGVEKRDFDGLTSALKACSVEVDTDSFRAKFKKWYSLCKSQKELTKGNRNDSSKIMTTTMREQDQLSFEDLAEEMRKAEIEVSIAIAPRQSLSVIKQRIRQIEEDRMKRFEILKEMLNEVCLREMDFNLDLKIPKKDFILKLPTIQSVSGIFDSVLEMFGEIK